MARASKKPKQAIEKLLAEKADVEEWLEKLSAAGNKTPKQVRSKVRGDYEARLQKVVKKLEGYRDDIGSLLEEQEADRERLEEAHEEVSERMAEAELRHSVGEYDEKSWDKLSGEIKSELESVQSELEAAENEIVKLQEIVGLIDEEGESEAGEDEEKEVEAVTTGPRPAVDEEIAELEEDDEIEEMDEESETPSQQTEAFDEMAFLKSVTEGSVARPSGSHGAVDLEAGKKPGEKVGAKGVEAVRNKGRGPTKGKAKKSIKCGECGAKNLPTEWYCERCGAELASL